MTPNQEARELWPDEAANVVEFISAVFWRDLMETAAFAVDSARKRFQERLAPEFTLDSADLPRKVFDLMAKIPEPPGVRPTKPPKAPVPNRKARQASAAKARRMRRRNR